MSLRIQSFLTGVFALIAAMLLALAPASANPASGGYQLFERAASSHQADIQLASLGNFNYHAKTASECCNAPNRTVGLDRLPCCFVAGTPIKTETGYTSIEQLEVGDWVLAQDVETGDISKQQVTDVHVRPITDIKTFYRLGVVAGEVSEDLYVTGEHPFWVPSQSEWVTVDELVVGTELTNHSGDTVRIVAKELQSELQQTYNITVEGYSSYFAGITETLVHNCGEVVGRTATGQPIHAVAKDGGTDLFVQTPSGQYIDAQRYDLATGMGRPGSISDPALQRVIDRNYRQNATVGSGSTADAVRYEITTGQQVGGVNHSIKANETITRLNTWLNNTPNASLHDRSIAQNMIIDMEDALATTRP